jgi:hypothetical protein
VELSQSQSQTSVQHEAAKITKRSSPDFLRVFV